MRWSMLCLVCVLLIHPQQGGGVPVSEVAELGGQLFIRLDRCVRLIGFPTKVRKSTLYIAFISTT